MLHVSGRKSPQNIRREREPPWTIKYVDDLNGGQTHYQLTAASNISTNKEYKQIHVEECEEIFKIVKRNATNIQMKVNDAKTNLFCISTNNNFTLFPSFIGATCTCV